MSDKDKVNHIKDLGFIKGFLIGAQAGLAEDSRPYKDMEELQKIIDQMQDKLRN